MIDSQAVKNTCNASIESKGFCFYKCTNGIKRHLAVDILGFPAWCIFMVGKPDRKCIRFFTHCTKASTSDDQGLIEMLSQHIDYFKSKPDDLPKTTILLDNGYHPEKLTQALEAIYPEIMTKIQCWAGDPIRDKLRRERSCQAGLSGWLKEKLPFPVYSFGEGVNNQFLEWFADGFNNSQILISGSCKIFNRVRG